MSGIEKLSSGEIKIDVDRQTIICSEHEAKRLLGGLWLVLMPYGTPAPKAIKSIDMSPEVIPPGAGWERMNIAQKFNVLAGQVTIDVGLLIEHIYLNKAIRSGCTYERAMQIVGDNF